MSEFNVFLGALAGYIWWPVLFLIIGGGVFFLLYSRFIIYRYFFHAIDVLRGKYDDQNAPGQISSYKALSTALASTVGMGNLSGVAAAIALGGPGALFWMWVTALIGMATNFFTSTLACLYRGKDQEGELQGGPMYVIREGLSKDWHFLAAFFCICCMVGSLPIFQANQLTQAIIDIGLKPQGFKESFFTVGSLSISTTKLTIGLIVAVLVSIVIVGGIQRIGNWAGRMVPLMVVLHFISVAVILFVYADQIPHYIKLIFTDAFAPSHYKGDPFLGGVLGGIIMLGVRRATFSNEAGIGTSPMAMGASKSNEPVREGLVSMLSPAIDTLLSCSLTALAILVTGVWQTEAEGITLTSKAYRAAMPIGGDYILLVCTIVFAISALFSYSYYGRKALAYLVGYHTSRWYDYFYLSTIAVGAVASMNLVLNIIDIAFALMAIPTMISAFKLAPIVMREAREYFKRV
ncbi:alanine/glycine:cation symporter family protein [Pseudochryseolinea flava]|uniref:Sodium/alanine symporter n=1 Tax=Pseudochryseolinea flava TaxID=2059302 RepID=A0A364Y6K6_9BACT|nr:amino acid carrier protein [Pseudochryseolinea flava]RAW01447.1 sodium/alanine symporter [Pseudochryseolinea flava]